jgi:hypothetical protein
MAKRPLTQREIRARKGQGVKRDKVTILNTSRQIVPITIKHGKGQDFFLHSQTIWLHPGKSAAIWKDKLYDTQISGLCKKRIIALYGDTEKLADRDIDDKLKQEAKSNGKSSKNEKEELASVESNTAKKTKKSSKKKSKATKSSPDPDETASEDTNPADDQELADI